MSIEAAIFYVFSTIAVIFALSVVLLENPVTSALALVLSFFGISGIFVLLHAPFLGIIQILVYAGAILVLFLYVTMLLNVGRSESSLFKSRLYRLGCLAGGLALAAPIFYYANSSEKNPSPLPETFGSIASIGLELLGKYVLFFELVSIVLLVAIIGAIVLSKRETGKGA